MRDEKNGLIFHVAVHGRIVHDLPMQIIPAECRETTLECVAAFSEPDFIFEEKHDGIRAVCHVEQGGNRVTGLRFNDDGTLAEISKPQAAQLRASRFEDLADSMFDGELMADGRYLVFDCVALRGEDLRGFDLQTRKNVLLRAAAGFPDGVSVVRWYETFEDVGEFEEGVVVKDLHARYGYGWWKAKRVHTDDVLVESVNRDNGVATVRGAGCVSGVPEHVVPGDCIEVEFFKRFASGKLRNGRFVRLRDDKITHQARSRSDSIPTGR